MRRPGDLTNIDVMVDIEEMLVAKHLGYSVHGRASQRRNLAAFSSAYNG